MDLLQEIETLYSQLPEVDCKGCGQCCVSPTCTLAEFLYLMSKSAECLAPDIFENFILSNAAIHPVHEGNLQCSLLAENKCLVHGWRTGACRLFGIPSLKDFGISDLVSCFNDIQVTSGRWDQTFVQEWVESVAALNEKLYPFGKAPYFIYGFNLECWLDIYFDDLLTVEVFSDIKGVMNQYIDMSAFASRYLLKTGLKEKVDKISLLELMLESGDKETLAEVLISIRDDYPLTGTYFVKEAQTYLYELKKSVR
jgi:Putative zinc- or iron-chelating domain